MGTGRHETEDRAAKGQGSISREAREGERRGRDIAPEEQRNWRQRGREAGRQNTMNLDHCH